MEIVNHTILKKANTVILLAVLMLSISSTYGQKKPIIIQEQGSFAVGGSVKTNPGTFDAIKRTAEGQTYHGDHAYVFYQIPEKARKLPLVLWHGFGQFSKTWETTPDGREGYQNIFLRRKFSVYVMDQPRRGRAGRSMAEATITPTPDEQFWFNIFRIGVWPDYFPGVQFAQDEETLNQYFRQLTPNIGGFDTEVITDATSALFDKIGEGILVTHSHSGGFGWATAMKNPNVRAIVSYEPGSGFPFPEGEVPGPIENIAGALEAIGVSKEDFLKLAKIPIIIYYGDNIPANPDPNPGVDGWRARLEMAKLWRDAINRHGGDVTVVHLPEIGIKGNTHFPFSDLNNVEIADLMSGWLKEKGLSYSAAEQEIINLSKQKWQWMADKNVNKLDTLFHDKSKFVHMSGSWKKARELEITESGSIWYKKAEIHDVAVEVFDNTAVLWNRITLVAHVRGNDVSNEFTVTEVYQKQGDNWKLLALTFSKVRDTHEIEH